MISEDIAAIAQFMARVPLEGQEALVWVKCMDALDKEMGEAIRREGLPVQQPPAPTEGHDSPLLRGVEPSQEHST